MNWALPKADTYFASILQGTPGGFEIDHLREALKHCTKFRIAVDGGAHVGTWSVHLASLFERVYAFEPAADTYACLVQNIVGHKNIIHYQLALGERIGFGVVEDDPTRLGNTGSRIVTPVTIDAPTAKKIVAVAPVDSFQFKQLDFLKLDVEGCEYPVLLGATITVARCRPVIVVECKKFYPPRNGGPERVIDLLSSWGYRHVGGVKNDRVFVPR